MPELEHLQDLEQNLRRRGGGSVLDADLVAWAITELERIPKLEGQRNTFDVARQEADARAEELERERRLLIVENVALRNTAEKVVALPQLAGNPAAEALGAVLAGLLGTRDLDAEDERDHWRQRAERAEAAAREVAYEIERMETLSEVPQLGQIAWWRGTLRAALADAPVGPDRLATARGVRISEEWMPEMQRREQETDNLRREIGQALARYEADVFGAPEKEGR